MLQVGYQPVAANFFFYSAIIFLLILISETLGMLCSGAFRAELTGAIVLQALYVPLLMFVGFFQVCDGIRTQTCSCLQETITCRPSACSPSCLSAPSDASCLQHQRRTDLSCRCQSPPFDRLGVLLKDQASLTYGLEVLNVTG